MSLATYTYRLKPQSGDTTAHDETTTGADLSGGTITLVDLGSGDYAWQIVGAASALVAAYTSNPANADSGITFAVRMAVTTWTATYDALCGYCVDTPVTGSVLTINGAVNNIRARQYSTANDTLAMLTVNTSIRTYVFKRVQSLSKFKVWIDTVGRSGSTANYTSPGQTYVTNIYDTVNIGASGTTIKVSDFVVWGEELSDADCAALADTGIRATLDAGGDTTAPTLTSPGTSSVGSTTVTGDVTTDEANGTLYCLVTTNATETAATVKATGTTQTITTTGAKSINITGLTASTLYYAHFVHTDAAANDSTVSSSASFTTAAASSTYAPNINKPRTGMGTHFYGAR